MGQVVAGAAVVISGGLVAAAVRFHIEDSRLERIEGVCTGDNCLPGSAAVDGWAHAFTVLGVIAVLITVLAFIAVVVPPPPKGPDGKVTGPSPHRKRAWIALPLVLAGLAAFLWPAGSWAASLPGKARSVAWSLPYENTGSDNGGSTYDIRSVWTLPGGPNLVRITPDTLTAHSLADGRRQWQTPVPTRRTVCGTATRAGADLALIGYARHDQPCAELAAVDLATGRTRWQQKLRHDEYDTRARTGSFALAGRTAVAVETERLRAFDTNTGKQAWTRPFPKKRLCTAGALDASADRVLLMEECVKEYGGDASVTRLIALDAATGKQLWRTALPVESPALSAYFASTAPVVLRVKERDERGVDAFLSYDDKGRARAVLKVSRHADGNRNANSESEGLIGLPGQARVVGDRLVAGAITPGETSVRWVGAFSLATGERQWLKRLPDLATALLTGTDGRLTVLIRGDDTPYLASYDLRTGRRTAAPLGVLGSRTPNPSSASLHQGPGSTVVVVNEDQPNQYSSLKHLAEPVPVFAIR
ncbi:PQQ-binding-like beta-propeller repeat protein [Streptomyces sp. NPDC088745]|uniref:outer membrane protein assembly factor BamB family protein n=1 Tax=Streptomyces sp. NPDC088745 TaxID=3365884 RepID=UPI003828C0FC